MPEGTIENAGNASSHIVQEAAEASAFANVKFDGTISNIALGNAVSFQHSMNNEMVRMSRVSEAVSGTLADRIINSSPMETAGEAKILYGTPPTGFTGVGHYPAEPATGS